MMKKIILVCLVILCINKSYAQNFDFLYSLDFGINSSFMRSKIAIEPTNSHNDYGVGNESVNDKNTNTVGLNAGLFINLKTLSGRFGLESGLSLASFNSEHSINIKYDRYNVPVWTDFPLNKITEKQIITLKNEFLIINVPIVVTYNLDKKIRLFGGLSTFLNIRNDNVKSEFQLETDHLYKDIVLGYQAGIEFGTDKFINIKYERTLNYLKNQNFTLFSSDYVKSEIESIYLNCITFSIGFRLFNKNKNNK